MRRLALTSAQEDLVAAYATELRALGLGSSARELVWGARVFCTRFDQPSDWVWLPVAERLSHNIKVHRFVTWLAATGRLRLDAGYLMARRSRLGPVLARHWPVFHAQFVETAACLQSRCSSQLSYVPWACTRALAKAAPGPLTLPAPNLQAVPTSDRFRRVG